MDPILNDNEYTEVEGRYYANPQVSLDESNAFIQNLRDTQAQQNQQIATDTYNLGTAVPSVQGGLGTNTASDLGYWTSRYQTPQTATTVADLRATAQAAALNQVLENEQAKWKKRYQDAYRAYQKSAYNKSNTTDTTDNTTKGGVDETTEDLSGQGRLVIESGDIAEGEDGRLVVDPVSGNIIGEGYKGDNPRFIRQEDGSYVKHVPSSSGDVFRSVDLIDLITDFRRSNKNTSTSSARSGFGGR